MRDFFEFIGFSIATVVMMVFMVFLVALMVAASTAPIWVTLLLVKLLFFMPTEKAEMPIQPKTEASCVTPTIPTEKQE